MSRIDETAFSAGRAAVNREQQRLRAEIVAFKAFAERVGEIEVPHQQQPQHNSSGAGTLTTASANRVASDERSEPFDAIRTTYRKTVFAVDHWQTAYANDTVEESIASEFSVDLATPLLDPSLTRFSSMLRDRLTAEARQAAATCERTLTLVDTEAAHLERLRNDLEATVEQVRAVECGSEAFETRVDRLETVRRSLEDLAPQESR